MPNFSHLLNKPADDVKAPVQLPDGTYYGTIQNHEFGESSQKKTPYVQYNILVTHADEGTDTEGVEVSGKKMNTKFYLSDEAQFMLVNFIKSFGIETSGRSLGELIPQVQGQSVMLDVVKQPNQAGDGFFNTIKKVSAPATEAAPAAEAPAPRRRSA